MLKFLSITGAFVVVAGLGFAGWLFFAASGPENCGSTTIAGGSSAIGGAFTLVDNKGNTVTDADVITGPTLIYFGYTYCPDVCPLDTARNAEAIDILDAQGINVKPVFITVDPERDTVDVIADFVEVIHPRMVGLTGTIEQIATVTKAFKAYYHKNGEGDDYSVDHSTFTYLMGPDGLWDFFRRDVTPEKMADVVACYVKNNS